jgi:hypothetical protein
MEYQVPTGSGIHFLKVHDGGLDITSDEVGTSTVSDFSALKQLYNALQIWVRTNECLQHVHSPSTGQTFQCILRSGHETTGQMHYAEQWDRDLTKVAVRYYWEESATYRMERKETEDGSMAASYKFWVANDE